MILRHRVLILFRIVDYSIQLPASQPDVRVQGLTFSLMRSLCDGPLNRVKACQLVYDDGRSGIYTSALASSPQRKWVHGKSEYEEDTRRAQE